MRLDIGASLRLFGGLEALVAQVRGELAQLGIPVQLAVAATPLAALWLARAGSGALCPELPATRVALAEVPLAALGLTPDVARRCEGFGLRCLGELLALPRAGLGRRLGRDVVRDLERALGERPHPQVEFVFPERFEQRLELPAAVETAPVLLFAAQRLIAALAGWLAARHAAVRGMEWVIGHGRGASTSLPLAFSRPVHGAPRIARVLREALAALRLSAPALELCLRAGPGEPRPGGSELLFDGPAQGSEALAELLDRLVARLGPQALQGLACHADHRPERASRDHCDCMVLPADLPPRPLWLLEPPEALREAGSRPWLHGALRLLIGPERIEAGWWDGVDARRDYFVAIDGEGRWLWVFRDSRPPGGWFLHGIFA